MANEAREYLLPVEFERRRDGMIYAMDGGLWLHRHIWHGHRMAHLVSTDRELLIAFGRHAHLPEHRLQYKPLKDPRSSERRDAWHWDLGGALLRALATGKRQHVETLESLAVPIETAMRATSRSSSGDRL
jgi:hypothetical protein